MGIKVEFAGKEENEEQLDTPCLMQSDDGDVLLVTREYQAHDLFKGYTTLLVGTLIKSKIKPIGTNCDDWFKDSFKLIPKGEIITLQNE